MSLQYLLDGYNIIHQVPSWTLKSLYEQRNALIDLIHVSSPQGSSKNSVTIVFDGKIGREAPKSGLSVRVVFSMEESADSWIIRHVQNSKHSKSMVVVTDDRQIQKAVKSFGAKVLSVSEFIAKSKMSEARGHLKSFSTGKISEKKVLSQTQAYKINRELENIWLKKRDDSDSKK